MSLSIVCVCVYLRADSCMGPEKHEIVPAGSSVLTQSGSRVWWTDGGVSRDQEYEKEPKLPQLCPLYQSGMTGLCKLPKYHDSGKNKHSQHCGDKRLSAPRTVKCRKFIVSQSPI